MSDESESERFKDGVCFFYLFLSVLTLFFFLISLLRLWRLGFNLVS